VVARPPFSANGYDLTMKREIKLSEAILGTTLSIPTLEKKEINLTIPPGTKHKTKMRLPGMGLPHMKAKGTGDLYILIHINIPEQLTAQQKKIIKQLAKTGL
jgi:curved DNA-binding protein